YVTCWYMKAAQFIQNTEIECAFVSTNSICQGLQVPILWPELMDKHGIKINFAHQTFKWSNEARGKAAVYCVIIGFALAGRDVKKIYQYTTVTSEPVETHVKQINAYLVDGNNVFIMSRAAPLCKVPDMNFGNMPADGGEFLFSDVEKKQFLKDEPAANKFFRPFISAYEFINNKKRWCLWLTDIELSELKKLKMVYERVKNVKEIRKKSARPHLADVPHLFAQITQPKGKDFILIPRVSSETRKYIPMGFFNADSIASDTCLIIPNGTVYHFGVLTSAMHMAWMRYVCGRLKSDYRYSKDIVYNNFPWPNPTEKQTVEIEKAAQNVLDVRAKFPNSSLANLYDPVAMPPALSKARQKLDKAVEAAYKRTFTDDSQRVAFLFELYEKLTGGTVYGEEG
ncbi:MAG: methylase, partial [Treponema sp.]|nr:methylase [Treponema sp.]